MAFVETFFDCVLQSLQTLSLKDLPLCFFMRRFVCVEIVSVEGGKQMSNGSGLPSKTCLIM